MAGASIDLLENANILRVLDQERRFDPDTLYLNPTIAAMLLKGRRGDRTYARSVSAGAAFPDALHREYRRRFGRLFNLYGSTELGAAATTLPDLEDDRPNRLTALPGVSFEIDPADGGLCCSHPWPFDGYLDGRGNPLATETRPYNTGDVARFLGADRIELLGRQGDSTNRSGFLVFFSDIENALLHTGLVAEAVVLSDQRETIRGDGLIALCVAKPGQAADAEQIRQACFEHLPRYAIPDQIHLRERFPITASGKIDRTLIQRQLHESIIS
jgi:acyl-CoA synthetase (AMP-forming)/AMP-acid ligase II